MQIGIAESQWNFGSKTEATLVAKLCLGSMGPKKNMKAMKKGNMGLGKPSSVKNPKTVMKKAKAKAKKQATGSKNAALEKAANAKSKNDQNRSK